MPRAPRTKELKAQTGERLRLAREAIGLRAVDVRRALNVEANTYSQWESGVTLLDITAAIRFRKRYGITLDWLFCDDLTGVPQGIATKIEALRNQKKRGAEDPFSEAS